MGRIGIFGGTFNPIHNGHVLAVEEFQRLLALDQVIVIPAAVPPHKCLPQGTPDAGARLAMVQAATAHLPYVTVSDIELRREGKSYTADTLRQLHAQRPGDTFFLLLGTDSFLSLDSWYEPEVIVQLATLVWAHRDAESKQQQQQLLQQEAHLQQLGARVIKLENTFADISSSTVRRMLAFGCGESYVPPAVMQSITAQGFYGVGEDWKQLPFDALKEKSLSLHKAKRVPHVIGCCQTAQALAGQYGANPTDAARAGILHDITKALDGAEQLQLCKKYDIMLTDLERNNAKLLHAKTGAAVAHFVFGENDAVCDAIYWHTTGKADMTLLEKIIYLADYMEPTRDFDGVEQLRDLAKTDLDAALLRGFEMSLELLQQRGKAIDPNSRAARDYLLRKE